VSKNAEEKSGAGDLSAKAKAWLSLDSWAVVLALGLSLLVWVGLIKRVPW
jgi:hypothetical protein